MRHNDQVVCAGSAPREAAMVAPAGADS
jgi:hypothetical protein